MLVVECYSPCFSAVEAHRPESDLLSSRTAVILDVGLEASKHMKLVGVLEHFSIEPDGSRATVGS